jgi:hypothetical protein
VFESLRHAFESDVRRGLEAVRAGLDGVLSVRVPKGGPFSDLMRQSATQEWKGFVRQWLCLTAATYAFDIVTTTSLQVGESQFLPRWQQANEAARFPRLIGTLQACQAFSVLNDEVRNATKEPRQFGTAYDALAPTRDKLNREQLLENIFDTFLKSGGGGDGQESASHNAP